MKNWVKKTISDQKLSKRRRRRKKKKKGARNVTNLTTIKEDVAEDNEYRDNFDVKVEKEENIETGAITKKNAKVEIIAKTRRQKMFQAANDQIYQ